MTELVASRPVSPSAPSPSASAQPVFGARLALGLLGILLAAMIAGLNSRVAGLTLADIQGSHGFSADQASWLDTLYAAGELVAMPFSTWFAITFSLRRFHLLMLCASMVIAALLPFAHNLTVLLSLRLLQGITCGALIPMLMMAALRFLPAPIRLHGLALYAMTATFAPNMAVWLAALWVDRLEDWRWVYWHIIPLGVLSAGLVYYGIPKLPQALPRIKQANWLGMALGVPGLILLAIGVSQGVRHDWFASPLISSALFTGFGLTILFVLTEWFHPAPFIKLQLLGRRNLGLGFILFLLLLVCMTCTVGLPITLLTRLHGFSLDNLYHIGLWVALPQIILGPLMALMLYQKWVDARVMMSIGLIIMGTGLWLNSHLTEQWNADSFFWMQCMQAVGQPMSIIAMLFLGTSVVAPMEGPFVSGIINTLRALGTLAGSALLSQLMIHQSQVHKESILNHMLQWQPNSLESHVPLDFSQLISQQMTVMAGEDLFRYFAIVLFVMAPVALCLKYIPAPNPNQ
jgi:DHA2 family multidrug resistance protein